MLIFSGCLEGECPLHGAMCWADPVGTAEAGELARPPQEHTLTISTAGSPPPLLPDTIVFPE